MIAICTILLTGSVLAAMEMSGLYIVGLVVGGGLLLISTFLGGDVDADVDVDMDVDVDGGDGHAHGHGSDLGLSNWFSMSFLIYFAAAFGAVGTVLTYLTETGSTTVLIAAVVSGLVIGQGVHHLMRRIKKAEALSPATAEEYINRAARVAVAIGPEQVGQIILSVRGGEKYVAARVRHKDDHFKINDKVVVVAYANGLAEVVSLEEFEFVTDSKPENANELDYIARTK